MSMKLGPVLPDQADQEKKSKAVLFVSDIVIFLNVAERHICSLQQEQYQ